MIPKRITQIILVQIIVTMTIATGSGIAWGWDIAKSSASGGGVVFLSAVAYALRSSMVRGVSAEAWLKAQYAGEKFKFAVTVLLIIVVTKIYPALHWLAFLLSFIATMTVYFVALLWD